MVSRFIPVDTGNTKHVTLRPIVSPVHPRGYGEHTREQERIFESGGSSPWIRGTQQSGIERGYSIRFIPVDTGNTIDSKIVFGGCTVHPRGYGEHLPIHTIG